MTSRRVLLVEDDFASRLRLADLLVAEGVWEVREAFDGLEALRIAAEFRPDLIILDLMLPSLTGYELCVAFRARSDTCQVPIIVVSAVEQSEAMIKALEAGADDFLRKPFFAMELRAKIRGIAHLNRFRLLVWERERFRWMVEQSVEPILIVDNQGIVIYTNGQAKKVFGLENRSRMDVSTAIGQYFRSEPADAWAAWRSGRMAAGATFSLCRAETTQLPAQWFNVDFHVFDEDGSQTLFKFTDNTQAVQRELELFTFQHLIAHKIRTPLSGIAPILSLLEESEGIGSDENAKMLLKMAQLSAERLQETLLGILHYHEALFAPRVPGFFNETHTVSRLFANASRVERMEGQVRLSGPDGRVRHGEVLELVLTELLNNYRKFSDASAVGVDANVVMRSTGQWAITLNAPGPGLPPQVVSELDRPYHSLERFICGEVPGTRLGLVTARLLMRSIGGDLEFVCSQVSRGVCSTVVLPLNAVEAADEDVT